MSRISNRRAIAAALVAVLCGVFPAFSASTADGRLHGVVMNADGSKPQPGIVVHLVTRDETVYSSQPSGQDGAFAVDAPSGDGYQLVAEQSDGRAYLGSTGMELQSGANPAVMLNLQSTSSGQGGIKNPSGGWEKYGRWILAGFIGIAALFVIDDLSDEADANEPTGSPMGMNENF